MLSIGDVVTFLLDGARGIVFGIDHQLCHVMWEDYFFSWERMELLQKDHLLTEAQRIYPME